MVLDTSAIMAILFDEPKRETFNLKIAAADQRLISAPTLVECSLVIESRKQALGRAELELFVYTAELIVVPFDQAQADLATAAWRSYGKGRHPTRLNLGDCFAYALAKARNQPLLFRGDDSQRQTFLGRKAPRDYRRCVLRTFLRNILYKSSGMSSGRVRIRPRLKGPGRHRPHWWV